MTALELDMSDNTRSAAWTCALQLRPDRSVAAGSFAALCDAIRRGADLRVYTEFVFEEHIVPGGDGVPEHNGLVREVIDFRETLLVDDRHAAGITTLRQPLHPPLGFNGRDPKMSYFLYNMDGQQACANLLLDAARLIGQPDSVSGPGRGQAQPGQQADVPAPADMPKMSPQSLFDQGTTGPSRNFIYEMEVYRFFVRADWEEVLAYDSAGCVTAGSFKALEAAQIAGREIRVGVRDLCADLGAGPPHEVFSHVGSGFVHAKARLYNALTHPLVRVAPAVPLLYASRNWDVAWVYLRTDGYACLRVLNPCTREFTDRDARFACRWFAR